MRKYALIIAAGILGLLMPTATEAAVGQNIETAIAAVNSVETIGCYRLGETGYHWYNFCLGPRFIYPHHRVCRRGYCYYR